MQCGRWSFAVCRVPKSGLGHPAAGLAGVSLVFPIDRPLQDCRGAGKDRMAFGYEYLMVYLPEFNRESFLLFVHNPAGSTKLRDYSSGRERVVGQPPLTAVSRATVGGTSRFTVDEHKVSGEDGSRYWTARTQEFNARFLAGARTGFALTPPLPTWNKPAAGRRNEVRGRASRGSQRQLQDYVNDHEPTLTRALIAALPDRLQELGACVQWVSPLAQEDYIEYRDADFLRAVGLAEFSAELADFWPTGGPSWDALAVVSTLGGKTLPGIVMVEAKSHVPEIYGSGCQASPHSRELIEKSLAAAKHWCGASMDADWTGPLYQSANRLAHLYFLRERLRRPAWLVNLYFTDDPYRPTSRAAWEVELRNVKASLGLSGDVAGAVELFLPGLSARNSGLRTREGDTSDQIRVPIEVSSDASGQSFAIWRDRWTALAGFGGKTLADHRGRIERIVGLWREPIPEGWQRGIDPQLLGGRYRRGNLNTAGRGEHAIEYAILCEHFGIVSCCGSKLVDGINAFPLSRDTVGLGRRGNVEADMVLLAERGGEYRMFLCEVKDKSNDPWYATVESLRQLRLFLSNPESRRVFLHRGAALDLPPEIPATALVLAPSEYFLSRGKKANAVKPALELIARCASEFGVDIRLAAWDAKRLEIKELFTAAR